MTKKPQKMLGLILAVAAAATTLTGCTEEQIGRFIAENSSKPPRYPDPIKDIDVDTLPSWEEVRAGIGEEAANIVDNPIRHADLPLTSKQALDVWDNTFRPTSNGAMHSVCTAKQGFGSYSGYVVNLEGWSDGIIGKHSQTQIFRLLKDKDPSKLNRPMDNDTAILLKGFGIDENTLTMKFPRLESFPDTLTKIEDHWEPDYMQASANCDNYEHRQLHGGGDFYERRVAAEQGIDALQLKRDTAIESNAPLFDEFNRFRQCVDDGGCDVNKDVPASLITGFLDAEKAAAAGGDKEIDAYFAIRREQRRAEAIYLYWFLNQPS